MLEYIKGEQNVSNTGGSSSLSVARLYPQKVYKKMGGFLIK